MTADPSAALRKAIAASAPVRAARDVLALSIATGEGETDTMSELTVEAAIFLKRTNPKLREPVDVIAQYIAETAALAGMTIMRPAGTLPD